MALSLGQPKTMAILNENTDFGVSGGPLGPGIWREEGPQGGVSTRRTRRDSPDYRSTLVNREERERRDRVHGLVRRRRHPAHAPVARDRPQADGVSSAPAPASPTCSSPRRRRSPTASSPARSGTQAVNWPGAKEFAKAYQERYGKPATLPRGHRLHGDVDPGPDRGRRPTATATRRARRSNPEAGDTLDGPVKFPRLRRLHQPEQTPDAGGNRSRTGSSSRSGPKEFQTGKALWPFPGWK